MSETPEKLALVVEDDALTREFLSEVLTSAGWLVRAAPGIDGAISALRETQFDLILSDVRLPDGDAFDLSRALKSLRTARAATDSESPPLIALSAEVDAKLAEALIDAGFSRVLEKPVPLTTLLDAVAELVSGKADVPHTRAPDGHSGSSFSRIAPHVDPMSLPHLDDGLAIRICGSVENMQAMRTLMRDELRGMIDQLRTAAGRNDDAGAGDVLHRLQSAAGFCGAARLGALIRVGDLDHADQPTVAEHVAPVLEASESLLGLLQHAGTQQQA